MDAVAVERAGKVRQRADFVEEIDAWHPALVKDAPDLLHFRIPGRRETFGASRPKNGCDRDAAFGGLKWAVPKAENTVQKPLADYLQIRTIDVTQERNPPE